jgi:hypothetical protein
LHHEVINSTPFREKSDYRFVTICLSEYYLQMTAEQWIKLSGQYVLCIHVVVGLVQSLHMDVPAERDEFGSNREHLAHTSASFPITLLNVLRG